MPKLSKSLGDAMNAQVQNELASAYLYLAMSTACAVRNLKGSSHWLRMQWEEELLHATKMLDNGKSETIKFTAPKKAGEYEFVCTFPGHWQIMRGIMKVVAP